MFIQIVGSLLLTYRGSGPDGELLLPGHQRGRGTQAIVPPAKFHFCERTRVRFALGVRRFAFKVRLAASYPTPALASLVGMGGESESNIARTLLKDLTALVLREKIWPGAHVVR